MARSFVSRRGFSLIEGLLAITVISLVSGITIPLYLNYQVNSDLNLAMEQTTQGLRRAQILSQSGEGDSVWGFYVPAGTLYKGASYAVRDQSVDEVYPMPSTITVSGSILEVAYSREGTPSQVGTITLTDVYGEQRLINITVPEVGIPTNESDTVTICHCAGGSGNCNTLTVSDNAWPAHQAHGDTLGICPGASSSAASSVASSSVASSAPASSAASSAAGGGGSSAAGACEDRYSVSANGTITATGPVNVTVNVLGSQITYGEGGPEVNVYLSYSKNGGSTWKSLFSGKDVDGGESATVSGLVSGNQFLLRAQAYYKKNGWLTFDRTYSTPDSSGHLVVLRDGDSPPDYPTFDDQESLVSYLGDLLDAQGKIDIGAYDVVIIGELGVQNLSANSSAVDFQDIVVKLQFTQNGSCN